MERREVNEEGGIEGKKEKVEKERKGTKKENLIKISSKGQVEVAFDDFQFFISFFHCFHVIWRKVPVVPKQISQLF